MPRGRRTQYIRDANGRFSSTPGGGPSGLGAARKANSPGARRKAKPQVTGGTLAARASLRQSRAKLATATTPQQKGAVTRASKKLTQVQQQSKRRAPAMTGVLRGLAAKKASKPMTRAAAKSIAQESIAAKKKAVKTSTPTTPKTKAKSSKPSATAAKRTSPKRTPAADKLRAIAIAERQARAKKIKATVNRRSTIQGKNFNDGQSVQTLSMAEMRSAVRQKLRSAGIQTKKEFKTATAQEPPRTRTGWEKLYREFIGVPQSDRNRRERPGVINGIDIQKNFRPWQVFGLDPKKVTKADIQSAYRRVAKKVHPDLGGRAKDLAVVKTMRDTLLAYVDTPSSKPRKPKAAKQASQTRASATPRRRGPLLLPSARN